VRANRDATKPGGRGGRHRGYEARLRDPNKKSQRAKPTEEQGERGNRTPERPSWSRSARGVQLRQQGLLVCSMVFGNPELHQKPCLHARTRKITRPSRSSRTRVHYDRYGNGS
jgi:hypothetical protein